MAKRIEAGGLRVLSETNNLVDFSSNDYLGLAKDEKLFATTFRMLLNEGISENGSGGSRLISGNHKLYTKLEKQLATWCNAESALVFNSGYAANLGFFSTVPQRGDIVFYDNLIHASIRDGIKLGTAKSYKFKHDDIADLQAKYELERKRNPKGINVYVVTEAVFSMDGDTPNIKALAKFCSNNKVYLVVDEAHALGVFGSKGDGLVAELGLEKQVFARIVTFGKALGCHGAAILGSKALTAYLVNFARSFIYTTAMPPHALSSIYAAVLFLQGDEGRVAQERLKQQIALFKNKVKTLYLDNAFITSESAIQSCLIPGNSAVNTVAKQLSDAGFSVKAIRSPTVPEGEERLRFCLHSDNSAEEIGYVLQLLKTYI